MPIDPEDFLSQASRIEQNFQDEIAYRCSISRAYYYVFHLFREQNRNHPENHFTGIGDHAEVSDLLKRTGLNDLADDFDDLRSERNRSDYDLDEDIDDMDLAIFKNNLEDFITGAKRYNFINR